VSLQPYRLSNLPLNQESIAHSLTSTSSEPHDSLIVSLFTDLSSLFQQSPPNFLILTVPPICRAPLFVQQGPDVSKQVADATAVFNEGLCKTVVPALQNLGGWVGLYETTQVFNVRLSFDGHVIDALLMVISLLRSDRHR